MTRDVLAYLPGAVRKKLSCIYDSVSGELLVDKE